MRSPEEIDKQFSLEEIQKQVSVIPEWWHSIQLGTKFKTPGKYDPKIWDLISNAIPSELSGKSVLDVGTADGGWAFECEKRNAKKIVAIDIFGKLGTIPFNFTDTGFKICKEILNSKVQHVELNVMDVEKLNEKFDIILFLGAYYHLLNPFLAFQKLCDICNDLLILEGEILESDRLIAYLLKKGEPGNKFLFSPSFLKNYASLIGFRKIEFKGFMQVGKVIQSDKTSKDGNREPLKRNRGIFYLWK